MSIIPTLLGPGDPTGGNSNPGGPLPTAEAEIRKAIADFEAAGIRNLRAEFPHPTWCDRNDCATRGVHRGRVVDISTITGDFAAVSVSLAQPYLTGDPFIIVTDGGGTVYLSINQARALCFATRNCVRLAGESSGQA